MQKSKKLQNQNSIKATLEDREKSSNQTAIFNQQNNFHLTQNIDIDKLNQLSNKNPELAKSIIVSLASAGFFAYFGHVKLAATAIVIPITITVANILNRNNNQKNKFLNLYKSTIFDLIKREKIEK